MNDKPMLSLRYLIDGKLMDVDAPGFQAALNHSYNGKSRPLCPCCVPPIPMYIARVNGHFIVKRMPSTGSYHDLECKSYEIPSGLSGLDQVLGSAIKENNGDGLTALRFDFALSKGTKKPLHHGKNRRKEQCQDGRQETMFARSVALSLGTRSVQQMVAGDGGQTQLVHYP